MVLIHDTREILEDVRSDPIRRSLLSPSFAAVSTVLACLKSLGRLANVEAGRLCFKSETLLPPTHTSSVPVVPPLTQGETICSGRGSCA